MDALSLSSSSASDLLQQARQANAATAGAPGKTKGAHQAAQDFEAVFIAQMLTPMFNTVDVDSEFGGGNAEETWRGVMVEEIGKHIARNGGFGLAPAIEKEMLRLQEVADGKPQ